VTTDQTSAPLATDLQDERLQSREGLSGFVKGMVDRARGGDLGVIPVVAGLVVIWTVFQILNPIFLSSANLVNLTLESAPVGVISLGIVCMLLVGEIDLSVGSVSGLSAAIVAVLFVQHGISPVLAVLAALLAGCLIGLGYAQMFNRFGVPSFVITLAGLLAFLGVQLYVLGPQGSINLPFTSGLVNFAQLAFLPSALSYALVLLAAGGLFLTGLRQAQARHKSGLSAQSTRTLAIRSVLLLVVLGVVVWYLNQTRGVGWMFVLFLALVLVMQYLFTRTKWGRSLRRRRQRRGRAPSRHQRPSHVCLRVRPVLRLRRPRWRPRRLAAGCGQPEQRHRQREPQRHRGRGHRRHQPVRRSRHGLLRAPRDRGHPVDLQRPDAAQPRLVLPVHGDRSGAAARGGPGLRRPPVACLTRPRLRTARGGGYRTLPRRGGGLQWRGEGVGVERAPDRHRHGHGQQQGCPGLARRHDPGHRHRGALDLAAPPRVGRG